MTFDFSEFKNKKIIVTGSSTGIGFETGVEFLNLGAKVIFHGNQSINDLEARIKINLKVKILNYSNLILQIYIK